MDELLRAISDLRINGTPKEEAEFEVRKGKADKRIIEEAQKMLSIIVATLALSNEFGQILDNSSLRTLEYYEHELKRILRIK